MGIDIAKMKAKLASSKGEGNSDNGVQYKLEPGAQTIRIVPTADGDPLKEFHFHYNMGGKAILCPKRNFDEHCPICEFASELWREGTEADKEVAKKLFVRQRYFSPVIVRGKEEMGVRLWGYGKKVYEAMLSLILNKEYGDITDPDKGTDLNLNYTKPSSPKEFPATDLLAARSSSKLGTKEQTALWLQNIPDFKEVAPRSTAEQVQARLDAFMVKITKNPEAGASTTERGGEDATPADPIDASFAKLTNS